ncbi:trna-guanine transglycosylase family protein [Ophiostoma piceae UAMH 11346]|uniref:Queuine tRNA-ribosyltransferase accessory subunit 2 n=1 Tax=Ophiostoma piceae (strain UAMH 11346) TaxID=1262450 RepID=S3D7L4_OPHP1|nr:trna-guanine transglycosylase family protein [Ophiostoma piceae UAMH 11346]
MASAAACSSDPSSSSSPSSPATTMPPSSSPAPLFRILKTAASSVVNGGNAAAEEIERQVVPRLGILTIPARTPIATPAFIAVTSRGVVPHVTPDNAVRTNLINGAYCALEDYIENIPLKPGRRPPVFNTPLPPAASSASPSSPTAYSKLRTFTALPSSAITLLAPRRHPAAASHLPNGPHHISIVTSTGFQQLTVDRFNDAVDTLRPDIVVPLADLTYGGGASAHTGFNNADANPTTVKYPSAKRALRMAERTEDWMDKVHRDGLAKKTGAVVFAPTLPVPYATQWQYLNRLSELVEDDAEAGGSGSASVSGLAVYDIDLLVDLHADYADTLGHLPRLSLHPVVTPHHVLRQVSLGADIMLLPAITDASEHGLAYVFEWPSKESLSQPIEAGAERLPLAIDLSEMEHKAAVKPLSRDCTCPACKAHHRAYIHHLLDAREMLAWTLLQFHNHHVMTEFFAGIRKTLAEEGVEAFQQRAKHFQATYEPELPDGKATRPRARGYQVKTGGVVETKLNKPAWGRLEDVAQEASAASDAPAPAVV